MNILIRNWKAISIFLFSLFVYFFLPASCPEAARRAAGILTLAALFWAFEILPLYATSILIVLLQVFLLTGYDDILSLGSSGYIEFLVPFASPIIMLFFGGFVIAIAMNKYDIDQFIASHLLKCFGSKPYFIMIGFMLTTALLSMWMSNTATTAVMITMIFPLLTKLDKKDPFRIALALSIAFAANIGGMGTPVGTPPNAIAIGMLAEKGIFINFLTWMKLALPLVFLLLFVTSHVLFYLFRPLQKEIHFSIHADTVLSLKGKKTLLVVVLTILFWLTSGWHGIPDAMVSIMAIGLLSFLNLVDQEDFQKVEWGILILMWGGLALGKGIQMSGLADWIVSSPFLSSGSFGLVVIFSVTSIVLSTLISNTATANLIIPIAIVLMSENPIFISVMVALSCSLAMALPISTPPNAIAFSTKAFSSRDMLVAGLIVSLISILLLLAGYQVILPALIK